MWQNTTSVPKENKRFYLTKKFLTKLNNGDTVLLRDIVYSKGRQPVGATSNPSARIYPWKWYVRDTKKHMDLVHANLCKIEPGHARANQYHSKKW